MALEGPGFVAEAEAAAEEAAAVWLDSLARCPTTTSTLAACRCGLKRSTGSPGDAIIIHHDVGWPDSVERVATSWSYLGVSSGAGVEVETAQPMRSWPRVFQIGFLPPVKEV